MFKIIKLKTTATIYIYFPFRPKYFNLNISKLSLYFDKTFHIHNCQRRKYAIFLKHSYIINHKSYLSNKNVHINVQKMAKLTDNYKRKLN